MKFIFFTILILLLLLSYFYFNKKNKVLRYQLNLVTSQYNHLKKKYTHSFNYYKNIKIYFTTPSISNALIKKHSDLLAAPLLNSPLIYKLDIMMEASILDCAIIDDNTWFYVSLPLDSNYNCRGWINSNDFTNKNIFSNNKKISKD